MGTCHVDRWHKCMQMQFSFYRTMALVVFQAGVHGQDLWLIVDESCIAFHQWDMHHTKKVMLHVSNFYVVSKDTKIGYNGPPIVFVNPWSFQYLYNFQGFPELMYTGFIICLSLLDINQSIADSPWQMVPVWLHCHPICKSAPQAISPPCFAVAWVVNLLCIMVSFMLFASCILYISGVISVSSLTVSCNMSAAILHYM